MFIIIIFSFFLLTQISSKTADSIDSNCSDWTEKHVVLAKDVHFFNVTFAFVKIDTLNDLNITAKCLPCEYNIEHLKIFATKNILLDSNLNLSGVLNIFNRSVS